MAKNSTKNLRLFHQSPQAARRMEVVEATIDSIAKDGFENLTFDSIAKRMGKRSSHVKYYFNEKDALVEAALRHTLASMQEYIIRAITPIGDPKAALETYLSSAMGYLDRNPRSWPMITLFFYYCSRNTAMRELHKHFRDMAAQRIAGMLEERGGIPPAEVKPLAHQIFMLVYSEGMEFIYDQDPAHLSQAKRRLLKRLRRLLR